MCWALWGREARGRMMGSRERCLGMLRGIVVMVVVVGVVDLVECKMLPRGLLRMVIEI